MSESHSSLRSWLRSNLRAKFALGLALPLLLILAFISVISHLRALSNLESQMEIAAEQLGEVALSSLRHGMLINDRAMVADVLEDMVAMEAIEQVQVINMGGETAVLSQGSLRQQGLTEADITCALCHQFPADERPRSIHLGEVGAVLRVAAPIGNEPECQSCHLSDPAHLGVLLIDVSTADMQSQLRRDLRTNLALSGGGALAVTLGAYLLSHWLVVRRVERFRQPLARFSSGDFSRRIPSEEAVTDEIGQLATAFNKMADHLERENRAASARTQVRQRAILEERDRIARELHDGMAQLLGYVNAKATAARLLVQSDQGEGAQALLRQLESAARELYTDVRAAIIGLKASTSPGLLFPESLRSYVEWFSELSDMPVEFELHNQGQPPVTIPPETELQVLRITQEALSNSRKHSRAASARVTVSVSADQLELRVIDDGIGFDPTRRDASGQPNFGLSTMRERAEIIGGNLRIESDPGGGTQVVVEAPLNGAN